MTSPGDALTQRGLDEMRARQEASSRRRVMSEPKVYRKKPVAIEAIEYHGQNSHEIAQWCGGRLVVMGQGFWKIEIPTLEGVVTASPGDYIIRGVQGEFYPCKPDIFAATYDEVTR